MKKRSNKSDIQLKFDLEDMEKNAAVNLGQPSEPEAKIIPLNQRTEIYKRIMSRSTR